MIKNISNKYIYIDLLSICANWSVGFEFNMKNKKQN